MDSLLSLTEWIDEEKEKEVRRWTEQQQRFLSIFKPPGGWRDGEECKDGDGKKQMKRDHFDGQRPESKRGEERRRET